MNKLRNAGLAFGVAAASIGFNACADDETPSKAPKVTAPSALELGRQYTEALDRLPEEAEAFDNYTSALPEKCREEVALFLFGAALQGLTNEEATLLSIESCPNNPTAVIDSRFLFGNVIGELHTIDLLEENLGVKQED